MPRSLSGLTLVVALCAAVGGSCGPRMPAQSSLRISGSNTVYSVAIALGDSFRMAHPEVRLRITGDGTARGIKFVNEGAISGLDASFTNRNKYESPAPATGTIADSSNGEHVDVGLSSRDLQPSEQEAYYNSVSTPFAVQGIAVATAMDVTGVRNLTRAQLKDIFSGATTNWQQVGGPNAPITVIVQNAISGTAGAWSDLVMMGTMVTPRATVVEMGEDMPMTIASHPGSVGYVATTYLTRAQLNVVQVDGQAPTEDAVTTMRYPLVRPFLFVTLGRPAGAVATWIDFAFSTAGQGVLRAAGAVPLTRGAH